VSFLKSDKIIIAKLPQNFITKADIKSNKEMLKMKIIDIYQQCSVCPNAQFLKEFCHNAEEFTKLNYVLQSTFEKSYNDYVRSKNFEEIIVELKKKSNTEDYIKLFRSRAKELIDYYQNEKPNNCPKKHL